MWYKSSFFKYATAVIMVLVIIALLGQINFLFDIIQKIIAAIFIPVVLAGFLFYLSRPLLQFLEDKNIPKFIAIILVFILLTGIFSLAAVYVGDLLVEQIEKLLREVPNFGEKVQRQGEDLIREKGYVSILYVKIQQRAVSEFEKIITFFSKNILDVLSVLPRFITLLFTVPFIFYYFLKDREKFMARVKNKLPEPYKNDIIITLNELDQVLSAFFMGQMTLAALIGVTTFIGFWIIALPYATILAFFILLSSFIPTFGIFIGIIPALLVGLPEGPGTILKILIILAVAYVLRKLVAPNILSNKLDFHNLTIIFLLLIGGALFGFWGILFVVPVSALLVKIIEGTMRIIRTYRKKNTV